MCLPTHLPFFKPFVLSIVDVYHSARVNNAKCHQSTYAGGIGTRAQQVGSIQYGYQEEAHIHNIRFGQYIFYKGISVELIAHLDFSLSSTVIMRYAN